MSSADSDTSGRYPGEESSWKTKAKQKLTINLTVTNWLRQDQHYDVALTFTDKHMSTFVIGPTSFEVGASSSQNYEMQFYSYVEDVTVCKVTFTNPETDVYVWYEFKVTAAASESFKTLYFDTVVRQTVQRTLLMTNPLPTNEAISLVTTQDRYWWTCDNPYIHVTEFSRLTGNEVGSFLVEYTPKLPTRQPSPTCADGDLYSGHVATLHIFVDKLGEYVYTLKLTATPLPTDTSSLMVSPTTLTGTSSGGFSTSRKSTDGDPKPYS